MAGRQYRFGPFVLDPDGRRLCEGERAIPLNARYFDALVLLIENADELVTKDRFNEKVWRSAPVTDEALTQCIRSLRQALRDKARDARFIETVPKHGYRFVAEVESGSAPDRESGAPAVVTSREASAGRIVLAASAGGAAAGMAGGLVYGLFAVSSASGAVSALLVLLAVCSFVGLVAGAGVGAGLALGMKKARAGIAPYLLGGALGGAMIGAVARMGGLDAFTLLMGRAPGDIAGALEGAVLGGIVGLTLWFDHGTKRSRGIAFTLSLAALAGLVAGAVLAFAGGRLMAGSLAMLAQSFEGSHARLDRIGTLFGEEGFGTLSLVFTTAFEGALFTGCVTGAVLLAGRSARWATGRGPACEDGIAGVT